MTLAGEGRRCTPVAVALAVGWCTDWQGRVGKGKGTFVGVPCKICMHLVRPCRAPSSQCTSIIIVRYLAHGAWHLPTISG